MTRKGFGILLAASLAVGLGFVPTSANACGGFFCSQAQGVNQAAERIVFASNAAEGTVTAVIEIQYQGPSDKFSWLLPISSVPEGDQIAVASSLSFQRLQQATNPQYSLTTRVEGVCDRNPSFDGSAGGNSSAVDFGAEGGEASAGAGDGITVEASGIVGSFVWTVISVDESLAAPADSAVVWLEANDYDVPPGAPGLLGPYLADGMYLLALKLVKGADAGSIRPIVLTYDAAKPMIPIKLTAVAANDDMGVLAWVLADAQAVPKNYNALELNDARINWFNPNANYNQVVIAAADEAGGQGFVTEYAQPGASLAGQLWTNFDESAWQNVKSTASSQQAVNAMYQLSQWDGFWEVVRNHVTWPADVTLQDVQDCPDCFQYTVSADFISALETEVIEPAQVIQKLFDSHAVATRLYSTLSAAEMTVDPLFTFNASLPGVSNVHVAERIIECAPGYYQAEAPWRIELPQGGVVRGGPSELGTWPTAFDDLPANRRILRQGETGSGRVLEDNSEIIDASITTYSASIPTPTPRPQIPKDRGSQFNPDGTPIDDSNDTVSSGVSPRGGSSCNIAPGASPDMLVLALAGLAGLAGRRRRRSAARTPH
jgi:MYXO-CTERM domain-containing protein